MKLLFILLTLTFGLVLLGCNNQGLKGMAANGSAGVEDEEIEIPLDQVPDAVIAAAQAAVPGIVLEEAEKEIEDGVLIYEVEGRANGVEYEIEVTADGKVVEVEQEDGDDEDDDDEDDD